MKRVDRQAFSPERAHQTLHPDQAADQACDGRPGDVLPSQQHLTPPSSATSAPHTPSSPFLTYPTIRSSRRC